jgi:hypothetical protein
MLSSAQMWLRRPLLQALCKNTPGVAPWTAPLQVRKLAMGRGSFSITYLDLYVPPFLPPQ